MTAVNHQISPLGSSSEAASRRRAARSAEYRAELERVAPFHVVAKAVVHGRAAKGLTQDELGTIIGTKGSVISRIESGQKPVSLATLQKLGQALDISFVIGAQKQIPGCVLVPFTALEGSLKPKAPALRRPMLGGVAVAAPPAMTATQRGR